MLGNEMRDGLEQVEISKGSRGSWEVVRLEFAYGFFMFLLYLCVGCGSSR